MTKVVPTPIYPVQTGSKFDTTPALSGTYIPAVWSGKLLEKFYDTSTFCAVANTNWEGDISKQGDEVIIRERPDVAVRKYVAGQALTYDHLTPASQSLKIDQGHYFGFEANDVLAYQSDLNQLDLITQEAAEAMKTSIDSTCWYNTFSDADAANKGATAGRRSGAYDLGTDLAPVTLTTANAVELVLRLASVLDEQNIPDSDRFLILDPYTRHMLFQSDLAKVYVTGDSASPIRNGMIGVIDRFRSYVTNLLPAASGEAWISGDGSENTITVPSATRRRVIVAGHKSALTFASQITKNETVRNPNDFGDFVRGLKVYGRKCAKPSALAVAIVN